MEKIFIQDLNELLNLIIDDTEIFVGNYSDYDYFFDAVYDQIKDTAYETYKTYISDTDIDYDFIIEYTENLREFIYKQLERKGIKDRDILIKDVKKLF